MIERISNYLRKKHERKYLTIEELKTTQVYAKIIDQEKQNIDTFLTHFNKKQGLLEKDLTNQMI